MLIATHVVSDVECIVKGNYVGNMKVLSESLHIKNLKKLLVERGETDGVN